MKFYYKTIYHLSLLFTFFLYPLIIAAIYFFDDSAKYYQQYFKAHMILFFFPILISFALSLVLSKFQYEKTPAKWNQWALIGILTVLIVGFFVDGTMIGYNYATPAIDQAPIEKQVILTRVTAYKDTYNSDWDLSKYGQIPADVEGNPYRFVLKLTVDGSATYRTADFFYEDTQKQYKSQLTNEVGKPIILTMLPHSKRIISIEAMDQPGYFLYQDPLYTSTGPEEN
ncbi:hypothetical protein [Neobacillus cucumis]|uniref:Uncharacterized protein n=1 Tax=Neobacillus cucumis TaxID=1740721 RepID=A0A2N5H9Y4_9BACI|nr:hypothetical protein [Neobacillus cucumis]PLS02331.1 hypothetical protein CVD27_20335 [Neobacillus cucumis]